MDKHLHPIHSPPSQIPAGFRRQASARTHTHSHTDVQRFPWDSPLQLRKPSSTEGQRKLLSWVSLRKACRGLRPVGQHYFPHHENIQISPTFAAPVGHGRETAGPGEFFFFHPPPGSVLHARQRQNILVENRFCTGILSIIVTSLHSMF